MNKQQLQYSYIFNGCMKKTERTEELQVKGLCMNINKSWKSLTMTGAGYSKDF